MLEKLIKFFVLNLVDKPEVVTISEIQTKGKSIIEVRVAPQDLAKVIGKEGRTFRALRTIINVVDQESKRDLVVDTIAQ